MSFVLRAQSSTMAAIRVPFWGIQETRLWYHRGTMVVPGKHQGRAMARGVRTPFRNIANAYTLHVTGGDLTPEARPPDPEKNGGKSREPRRTLAGLTLQTPWGVLLEVTPHEVVAKLSWSCNLQEYT